MEGVALGASSAYESVVKTNSRRSRDRGTTRMLSAKSFQGVQSFVRDCGLSATLQAVLIRCIVGFVCCGGRPTTARIAGSVRSQARHRAGVGRWLGRKFWGFRPWYRRLVEEALALESRAGGEFFFAIDQSLSPTRGKLVENTFSTGNRRRRPRKGRRYGGYKTRRSNVHAFVFGLLLTPSGMRIPGMLPYYTTEECKRLGRVHRTQAQLGAQLVDDLPLPAAAKLTVLGDTAYDAPEIRDACQRRGAGWIVPANPERVVAGPKGRRPKLREIQTQLAPHRFQRIALPSSGPLARCRRPSGTGRKEPRVFHAYGRTQDVHRLGPVLLVWSTKEAPRKGKTGPGEVKTLMTGNRAWSAADVVARYAVRWQIEVFFKEMKSHLGMCRYRFREFRKAVRWVEACLAAFLYLEWRRAKRLALLRRKKGPAGTIRWWERARTPALVRIVRHEAERSDWESVRKSLATPTGRKKLNRLLVLALQTEDRIAA